MHVKKRAESTTMTTMATGEENNNAKLALCVFFFSIELKKRNYNYRSKYEMRKREKEARERYQSFQAMEAKAEQGALQFGQSAHVVW